MVSDTPNKDNSPLHEAYNKARTWYVIFGALLLAWELIGIELTEASIVDLKVKFNSPEAIPFLILAVIVYSGIRYQIEWKQIPASRRLASAIQWDYYVSHIIAIASILVFITRLIINIHLLDLVPKGFHDSMWYGAMVFAMIILFSNTKKNEKEFGKAPLWWKLFPFLGAAIIILLLFYNYYHQGVMVFYVALGGFIGILSWMSLTWLIITYITYLSKHSKV